MEESKIELSKTQVKREVFLLAAYIILFFAAWTLKEALLSKMIGDNANLDINARYLITGGVKILLWVVPVFVYLKFVNRKNPLSYLKMNSNVIKGFLWGTLICVAYIGISLLKAYISGSGRVAFSLDLDNWLNTIFLAGFTEEIVFRGFLFQKIEEFFDYMLNGLKKETAFWGANIITSLLFVFIHFPRWHFNDGQISLQSMFPVFVLGIAFGFTFKKTGSIWASMIFHATNNFIVLTILAKGLC